MEQGRLCIAFIQQRKSGREESTWFLRSRFSSWHRAVRRNALILSDHSTWWNHSWCLTCKLRLIFWVFFLLLLSSLLGPKLPMHTGMGASSFSFQPLTWFSLILSKEWKGSPAKATLAAVWYSKDSVNVLILKGYATPCPGHWAVPCAMQRTLTPNGEEYPCCLKVLR